jgi:hypothetical protein
MKQPQTIRDPSGTWQLVVGVDASPEERALAETPPPRLVDRWLRDPLHRDALHTLARRVGSFTDAAARDLLRPTIERHLVPMLHDALRTGRIVAYQLRDDTLGRIRPLAGPPAPPPPPPPPPIPPVNPVVTVTQPVVVVKHPSLAPRRQPVTLTTDSGFDGQGTASIAGGGRIKLFDAATGGNELTGAGLVFQGAALTSGVTVYAEGASASGAMNDVRVTLSLSGGSKPTGPDAVGNLTAVEVIVEIHQSRTSTTVDPAMLSRDDKINVGRFVHKQYGDKHGRAMVTVRKARPSVFNGDLELTALNGNVTLFDAERGGASVTLPHTIPNGAIPVTPTDGVTFWLEGATVSGALRDTGLKLGVAGVDPEGDLARVTVVEFQRIQATIPGTPPKTARMGNGPVADHTFEHGASPAPSDYDVDTATNVPLVLVERSLTGAAPARLEVAVVPADVPVRWAVHRDDRAAPLGDHADVIALSNNATPALRQDATNPLRATLAADAVGTFHVRPFVDCNGSGTYEHGIDLEPCTILNVVLVGVRLHRDRAVTHNTLAAAPIAGGGISMRSGSFDMSAPATEAIHLLAEMNLTGGGGDGRRGVDRVFAGWVNNMRGPIGWVGTYRNRTVTPVTTSMHRSAFVSNITDASGGTAGIGTLIFLPTDPPAALLPAPILDTGRRSPGSGGNTACLSSSRVQAPTDLPVGRRITVAAIDSPGSGASGTHTVDAAARLEHFEFRLEFHAALCVWTNNSLTAAATGDPADRLYSVCFELDWDMLGAWNIDPATGNITITTAPTVTASSRTTHAPPEPAQARTFDVRSPAALHVLVWDDH